MTKSKGVGRGRRTPPFRDWLDRFKLAVVFAGSVHGRTGVNPRLNENAALDNMAVLLNSHFTADDVHALRRPGSLGFGPAAKRQLSGFDQEFAKGEYERLKKRLARLERRIESGDHPEDAKHLFHLAAAVIATLADPDQVKAIEKACLHCTLAGEIQWFEQSLRPHIESRFRPA